MQIPDLVGALEAGLRVKDSEDSWGGEKVHMSDLAVALGGGDEKCARQVWQRLRGEEKAEHTLGRLFMFDHGHRIHERVTDLIRDGLLGQGWEITGVEVPVNEFLPDWMKGTLDLEIRGPDGEKVIVDYKTINGNGFRYLNNPKPSNKLQLQGYMMVTDADYGILLYLDREGSNTPVVFIVERDDAAVVDGMKLLEEIKDMPEAPARMLPKVKIQKNKGPDAVKLELPWQCSYCEYLDVSCPGALRPELRGQIVGYRSAEGLQMKEEYENLAEGVAGILSGDI